jgi:hypothetical protein
MTSPTDRPPGPVAPSSVATLPADPRALIDASAYSCVVDTVLDNNPGMERDLADRIVAEALKFVAAVAKHRDRRMAPSRVVDEGWHALILHTWLYQQLCESLGGFVHHFPERPDPTRFNGVIIRRTTELIAESGYDADLRLWGNPQSGEIVVAASCQHTPPDCQVTCMNKPG